MDSLTCQTISQLQHQVPLLQTGKHKTPSLTLNQRLSKLQLKSRPHAKWSKQIKLSNSRALGGTGQC